MEDKSFEENLRGSKLLNRKAPYGLNAETNASQTIFENGDHLEGEENKKHRCLHKTLKMVSKTLKFWSFGQYITKFYRKRKAKYSSISGGLVSLILCLFIFVIVVTSFWNVFQRKTSL